MFVIPLPEWYYGGKSEFGIKIGKEVMKIGKPGEKKEEFENKKERIGIEQRTTIAVVALIPHDLIPVMLENMKEYQNTQTTEMNARRRWCRHLRGRHPTSIAEHKPFSEKMEEIQQHNWVWRREALQNVSCSINLYWKNYASSIIDVLQTIADADVDLVREFRNGPFGLIMNFIGGTSCNTALHALMAREISVDGALDHEVWFRIGGTNIRFSPIEYALVTGLMFGGSDFDPYVDHRIPQCSFYSRVLSCTPIKISDLYKRFITYNLGDDPSDYVKVANVLFLYNMLIGYDQPRTIDNWVWVLVEDTDRWKFFPWGSYSFGVLLNYMRRIPLTEADFDTTSNRRTYHFYGPVWALQIWAYEAIPRVGRHCAEVVSEVAIPRCLKWKFFNKVVRIGTLFSEDELMCHVCLEPTEYERDLRYFKSTQLENLVGVPYVVKLQRKKRPCKVTHPRAVTPPRASTPPRARSLPRELTPPRAAAPAISVTRSMSRRSAGYLPRTCGKIGAVDTITRPTSGRRRGKRVRTSTSSSGTSEEHVCCRHVDRYREIAREAAQEAARETASRFEAELERRINLSNKHDEGVFNQLKDFLTNVIKF
ncbi:hypothetical protein C2S53_018371 [Perilla frutescens var. hirtella]|uniref:DUF1985 domain-containing protein n=1 Tax=Perilla frutescens var. hirtella TaxID=608512 RepID=A0AAD4P080_PERFH|nr:hypothetical protein C2S53_018371 [Perilla frutescens var. hirtella]